MRNKIDQSVLKACFENVVEHFDKINDAGIKTEYFINSGCCYAAAYIVNKLAATYGISTKIYSGPYHVYLVKDDKIYDVFYKEGCKFEDVKLDREFVAMQMEVFDEGEIQFSTFDHNFYIGSEIQDISYLLSYFGNNPHITQLINKCLQSNGLELDDIFSGFLNKDIFATLENYDVMCEYYDDVEKKLTR